ncbi:MAG: GNAT family N-acetyltransferase [Methanobacteriota archaeon]|nr:MAG: GNAT family N-acetyltransferase [Euryarchaeota archaeon]
MKENLKPRWIKLRRFVAMLEPFPHANDTIPPLPPDYLLGRVVYDYCNEDVEGSAHAWICMDKGYCMQSLHVKSRNQTRKAIREGAQVVRMTWDDAAKALPIMIEDTFKRQGRSAVDQFKMYISELRHVDKTQYHDAIEIWGAKKDGVFGAIIIGIIYKQTYYILHQLSKSSELKWCPNNILTYQVVQRAFGDLDCEKVNYGVDGLDNEKLDGLARFKKRMGFELLPCKEKYVGRLGIIPILMTLSWAANMIPTGSFLDKYDSWRMLRGLYGRL